MDFPILLQPSNFISPRIRLNPQKACFPTCRMPRWRTMMSDGLTKEWTRATWSVTCCHMSLHKASLLVSDSVFRVFMKLNQNNNKYRDESSQWAGIKMTILWSQTQPMHWNVNQWWWSSFESKPREPWTAWHPQSPNASWWVSPFTIGSNYHVGNVDLKISKLFYEEGLVGWENWWCRPGRGDPRRGGRRWSRWRTSSPWPPPPCWSSPGSASPDTDIWMNRIKMSHLNRVGGLGVVINPDPPHKWVAVTRRVKSLLVVASCRCILWHESPVHQVWHKGSVTWDVTHIARHALKIKNSKITVLLSRYITIYQCISRYIKVYQGISRYIKVYQGISRYITVYQGISGYIKVYQGFDLASSVL